MRAWFIVIISSLFYFYQYILRVSPSEMASQLVKDFAATDHQLGVLSSAFFLTYTLMQIPSGLLLDRFGVQRLLPSMALICSVGCLIFGLAPHFYVATLSRLLMGFAAAFAFISCMKLANNWIPPSKLSLLVGIVCSIGLLGNIIGETPLRSLIDHLGWRESMFLLSILGFFVAGVLWKFVQDSPQGEVIVPKKPFNLIKQEFKEVLRNKQLWYLSGYCAFVAMPFFVLSSMWGVPFIMARYQVRNSVAATAISFILLGIMCGGPILGALSDHLKRRMPFLIIASIAPVFFLLIIIYYPFPHLLLPCILLFCFGFFTSGFFSSFAMVCEISKPENSATALGILNTANTFLVIFLLPFLGRILDFFSSGALRNGVRIYQLSDYQFSMTFMLVLMMISIVFLCFIKEPKLK